MITVKPNILIVCCIMILTASAFTSCNNAYKFENMPSGNFDLNTQASNLANQYNYHLHDSVFHLLKTSNDVDTLEYKAFYNDSNPYSLLYFKSGKLFNLNSKNAIALYTINDTTINCSYFTESKGRWVKMGDDISMHITSFSPAYFNIIYDDYNFDGISDMMVVVYNSMGASYSYGYLITYNEKQKRLKLHNETLEIASMVINKKSKTMLSIEYSNPNSANEKFRIERNYKWINDTMKIVSKKKFK